MTLIRPSLDYTAKDFDTLSARIFNIIPSAFPEWDEVQVANFGNMLVELFAYVGDVLLYYQDNQAGESRWSTAILRSSIFAGAKLVGYQARGGAAASTLLTVELNSVPAADVTFAAGDKFATAGSGATAVVFQVLEDTVLAGGTNPPVAFLVVENSESATESFTSTGLADQFYTLSNKPYIDGSLTISATNGAYTIVQDFILSTATDRHVVVALDENAQLHVRFGNAVSGAIPVGDITFKYKVGGGEVGNVARGTIVQPMQSYSDALGNAVAIRVINATKAGGGDSIQSIESIREEVPRSLRALTRTVAREDYEIVALRVPGVARALMLSRDEKPSIQENRGVLYIVPTGGGTASQALLDAVTDAFTTKFPKTITFKVLTRTAPYVGIDISTRVHFKAAATQAEKRAIAAVVKQNLTAFFALKAPDGSQNNNVDFGYYMDGALAWSDVFNVIRDTVGIRKVDDGIGNLVINGESDDFVVPPERFPILGGMVVIDALTGAEL